MPIFTNAISDIVNPIYNGDSNDKENEYLSPTTYYSQINNTYDNFADFAVYSVYSEPTFYSINKYHNNNQNEYDNNNQNEYDNNNQNEYDNNQNEYDNNQNEYDNNQNEYDNQLENENTNEHNNYYDIAIND